MPHGDDVERRNEATSLMTGLTSAAPSCNCFGWCSVLQVERFFAALPAVVTSASSPWYIYATMVYGSPPPLPLPLSSFGVFMLPLADERVPLEGCASGQARTCDAARCAQWLEPAPEVSDASVVNKGERRASYNRSRAEYLWQRNSSALTADGLRIHVRPGAGRRSGVYQPPLAGLHRCAGAPFRILHRTASTGSWGPLSPQPVANNSWVEVLRHPSGREGMNGYGCWFHVLLPPYSRGSGTFVNVGRTLVFPTTSAAQNALQPTGTVGDRALAASVAQLNVDSVQMLQGKLDNFPELLLAKPSCMTQTRRLGVCVPEEVRTGWHARSPCACKDGSCWQHLNCGQPLWPREPRDTAPAGDEGGSAALAETSAADEAAADVGRAAAPAGTAPAPSLGEQLQKLAEEEAAALARHNAEFAAKRKAIQARQRDLRISGKLPPPPPAPAAYREHLPNKSAHGGRLGAFGPSGLFRRHSRSASALPAHRKQ